MRTLLIALCVTGFAATVSGQNVPESKVPQAAVETVKKLYPKAQQLKWEKEDGKYEAGFNDGAAKTSLLLNAQGQVLETEVGISPEELPAAAKTWLAKNHAGHKVAEAARITDAKGTVTYEAEVHGKDFFFDKNGTFLH